MSLAVVIGSGGGLGAALLTELQRGAAYDRVVGLSRQDGLDLEDEDSIARAAEAVAASGQPDLVLVATGVLHSGFAPERGLKSLTAAHMLRDYRVNAVGPALVARHFLPLLPRDRRAVFAALSARVGSIGDNRLGGWHAYRASKAALNMVLRNCAIELGRTHPRAIVVGLHPGTVDTDLSKPFQKGVPSSRLFTPETSAAHLLAVVERLQVADSGGVFAWDGTRIPE